MTKTNRKTKKTSRKRRGGARKTCHDKEAALQKLSQMPQEELLQLIPHEVKDDFLKVGFSKWKKGLYWPILQLGPFDLGEVTMKYVWMNEFHKWLMTGKETTSMKRLVFWYGTKGNKCFAFICASRILSYEEGCKREYNKLPPKIHEKKCKNSLTKIEMELDDGLQQLERDLTLDPKDRAFYSPPEAEIKNWNMPVKRKIEENNLVRGTKKAKKVKRERLKVNVVEGLKSNSEKSEKNVSPVKTIKVEKSDVSIVAKLQEGVSCELGEIRNFVDDKALAFAYRVVANYGDASCADLEVSKVVKCAIETQHKLEKAEFGPCKYDSSTCLIYMPQMADALKKDYLDPRMDGFNDLDVELRQLLCTAMALTQAGPEWHSIQLPNLRRYFRNAFPGNKNSSFKKFNKMIQSLSKMNLIAHDETYVKVLVKLEDIEICLRRLFLEEDTIYGGMVKHIQKYDSIQSSGIVTDIYKELSKNEKLLLCIATSLTKVDPACRFIQLQNLKRQFQNFCRNDEIEISPVKFQSLVDSLQQHGLIKFTKDSEDIVPYEEKKINVLAHLEDLEFVRGRSLARFLSSINDGDNSAPFDKSNTNRVTFSSVSKEKGKEARLGQRNTNHIASSSSVNDVKESSEICKYNTNLITMSPIGKQGSESSEIDKANTNMSSQSINCGKASSQIDKYNTNLISMSPIKKLKDQSTPIGKCNTNHVYLSPSANDAKDSTQIDESDTNHVNLSPSTNDGKDSTQIAKYKINLIGMSPIKKVRDQSTTPIGKSNTNDITLSPPSTNDEVESLQIHECNTNLKTISPISNEGDGVIQVNECNINHITLTSSIKDGAESLQIGSSNTNPITFSPIYKKRSALK